MEVVFGYRTHNCGELSKSHLGLQVRLCGWVRSLRYMGKMCFVDLADRYGITQIVWENPDENLALGREDVIRIEGTVKERIQNNPQLSTGEIEVAVNSTTLLSKSELPPFTIRTDTDGGLELRMKYRYLDLRRPPLQENLILRHKIKQAIRNYLDAQDFLDIETPFLIRSTPEGARDFVVPSRMHPSHFYALPQSPQIFKQLLMLAGYDRYYQIARCFRDEDLRADRQPEFTQLDCEMSFVGRTEIMQMFEGLLKHLLKSIKSVDYSGNFPILSWYESISRYGTDKPDIGFDMELWPIPQTFQQELRAFPPLANAEHMVSLAITRKLSRKDFSNLEAELKRLGYADAQIFYILQTEELYQSSFDKYIKAETLQNICQSWRADKPKQEGFCWLICGGEKWLETQQMMGDLRLLLADNWNLRKQNVYNFLWVVDFPLFEWNADENRYYSLHHPFTAPKLEQVDLLDKADSLDKVLAEAYDLVLNGVEIGGGSLRITDSSLQKKIFQILGLSEAEAQAQFGFLLEAFRYGTPPHGGIAFGLDRICALFGGSESIRDFIAFPKNNRGRDLMLEAPTTLAQEQLQELGISLTEFATNI